MFLLCKFIKLKYKFIIVCVNIQFTMVDIEELHRELNGVNHLYVKNTFDEYDSTNILVKENIDKFKPYVDDIIEFLRNGGDFNIDKKKDKLFFRTLQNKYKMKPRNSIVIYIAKMYYSAYKINEFIYNYIIDVFQSKACRSNSGILQVAIMTNPGDFSCSENCGFCPKQEGFPRSYIEQEPAVRRAAQEGFDTVKQMHNRLTSYSINGHDIDKLEIIVLGGTWSNYPKDYQKKFMTEIYYSANTFFKRRETMYDLETEKTINESTYVKITGLTIETRPDYITEEEAQLLISYGVTRVQLGIQTTDDYVLKKVLRNCYTNDVIKALYICKKYGLKVLAHLMQALPYASPESDMKTFDDIIYNPELQVDELKIYPTSVTTTSDKDNTNVTTLIEKWYKEGKYKPYSNNIIMQVIIYAKIKMPRYIRISRVFRDIPKANITAGADIPHMRQILQQRIKDEYNCQCKCIKCREIKDTEIDVSNLKYDVEKYEASGGTEYFISANTTLDIIENSLVGFCRLRITKDDAIIRELHVYGIMTATYFKKKNNSQHKGVGGKLIKMAENITKKNNINKLRVIAAVGTRNYYRKYGYKLENYYMTKVLTTKINYLNIFIVFYLVYFIIKVYLQSKHW